MNSKVETQTTRREFVAHAAVAALPAVAALQTVAHAGGSDQLKVGVIGCGGRGRGAAMDSINASPITKITALADVFPDRVAESRIQLKEEAPDRADVAESMCFTGFDAYKNLLATYVDIVILATAPGFRALHFAAAIAAGKHVFLEKPVAVDPTGIRLVLETAGRADAAKKCVVAGTQRRHEACYIEAMRRVSDGAIGEIVAARCYWNMGGLWMKPRKAEWSSMEWQIRNWLYFTWLSGDHIVEQHVHNIDVINWATGSHPVRAMALGGRQVRTAPDYGNIFDHFAVDFEYGNGVFLSSMCRQTDGCAENVSEVIHGTKGILKTASGMAVIEGAKPWKFEGENNSPYVQEHRDLIDAIQSGRHINEARAVAESTLCAIMGRMSAYTGKVVTFDFAMKSQLNLMPAKLELGDLKIPDVAVPGRTPLI